MPGRAYLPATVFAVVFDFLRPTFTNLSFILERDQFARVLLDAITVGTVICASTSCFGRCSRTQKHYGSAINDKMNALKTFTAIISYSIRFVGLVGGIASNATVTKGRV
jgi:hypothetical protein